MKKKYEERQEFRIEYGRGMWQMFLSIFVQEGDIVEVYSKEYSYLTGQFSHNTYTNKSKDFKVKKEWALKSMYKEAREVYEKLVNLLSSESLQKHGLPF